MFSLIPLSMFLEQAVYLSPGNYKELLTVVSRHANKYVQNLRWMFLQASPHGKVSAFIPCFDLDRYRMAISRVERDDICSRKISRGQ